MEAVFLLGSSVVWGALDWAATRGAGGVTGTLKIDRCETRPGTKSTTKRMCLGGFRPDTGGAREPAEVRSQSKEGTTVRVTRTLLGKYMQRDD